MSDQNLLNELFIDIVCSCRAEIYLIQFYERLKFANVIWIDILRDCITEGYMAQFYG